MRSVTLGLLCISATASADPQTGKQLAAEAEALAGKGELVAAAAKFREAFAADPLPEYLCNVGVAYHKAKDLPRAHRYLKQCVTIGASLDATYLANVTRVIEAAEAKLHEGDFSPVDILIEPTSASISIEDGLVYDEAIVGAGRFWFPYGSYKLVLHAEGFVDKTVTIDAKSDAAIPLRERLERAPVVTDPPPLPPVEPARSVSPSKAAAISVSIGVGATGIIAGALYVKARVYVNDAEAATSRPDFETLHGKAHDFQQAAWIVGGVAGAGAIVAGLLWYRAMKQPSVEVTATGSGAAVTFSGRF